MAKTISSFPVGTQKYFEIYVIFGGSPDDISADTATLFLKKNRSDSDANAVLEKAGDCVTKGADSKIVFLIEPTDTKEKDPGKYQCGVHLERASGAEYILIDQELVLKDRISDV
jgi:hypothetical protein